MQIFTVIVVSKYLNCSVSCIRTLVRNKQIPFFRIGSKLNFNKEAVDQWIKNQEIQNMQQTNYSSKVNSLWMEVKNECKKREARFFCPSKNN